MDSLIVHKIEDVFDKVGVREVLTHDQRMEVHKHIISVHYRLHYMKEESYSLYTQARITQHTALQIRQLQSL